MNPTDPMQEHFRIKELAKQQAQALRREAIDDFWRGADAAWAARLDTARRSAQRLAYRLARHAQGRAVTSQPAPCKEG